MPDAKDQVDMARVALRKAIASAMVRKEQAEEVLSRLRPALEGRTADRALAAEAGDAELERKVAQLVDDLEGQVALQEQVLATADGDIETLKEELRGIDGLVRQAERVDAVSAVREAEAPPDVKEATLNRVRASIDALGAEADLNDELRGEDRVHRQLEAAAADAAAKAKLAEMKAQHALSKASEVGVTPSKTLGPDDAQDAPSDPTELSDTPKRKKTM